MLKMQLGTRSNFEFKPTLLISPLVIPVTRVSSRKIRFELYWLPMGILFEIA
jgi:hypothetical protein